jgi:hypothetical protein
MNTVVDYDLEKRKAKGYQRLLRRIFNVKQIKRDMASNSINKDTILPEDTLEQLGLI